MGNDEINEEARRGYHRILEGKAEIKEIEGIPFEHPVEYPIKRSYWKWDEATEKHILVN